MKEPNSRFEGLPSNPGNRNAPLNSKNGKGPRNSKGRFPMWAWIVTGLLVVILGFGTFALLRFNSFKDDTFGGRNEASLLPTVTPTLAPKPKPTATPTTVAVQHVAQETPVIVPTAIPTIAPTSTPEPPSDPIIRKIQQGEKISVLILGYGGGNHDGNYLTDTILQVVFDPAKKTVSMINIPRDTWVFVPYGDNKVGFWGKANSAFAYIMNLQDSRGLSNRYRFSTDNMNSRIDAAVILTKDVVENITGVPVDYWAAVSFDGFRDFIDAIGGINVNVEIAFDDYEYPRNDDPNIDASVMHIHFDAGPQHMNGERAIEYSRSRHSLQDGNDFGRSKRQMNVLAAVKEKAASPDILLKAFSIMNALQGKVRTSLSFDQVTTLANYFRSPEGATHVNNLLFVPFVISTNNFLYSSSTSDGAYILLPYAGQSNYKAIQDWIQTGLQAPELRLENQAVQVQNATGLAQPATTATSFLKDRGFNIIQPVWQTTQQYSQIIDYSNGKAKETLKALKSIFPYATVKNSEPPYKGYNGPGLVVVLGKDYTEPEADPQYPQVEADNPTGSTGR